MPATAPGDLLQVIGTADSEGRYVPSATTPGEGTVFLDGEPVVFTGLEPISASGFAKFSVETLNSLDLLAIQPVGAGRHQLTGTSGGVLIGVQEPYCTGSWRVEPSRGGGGCVWRWDA